MKPLVGATPHTTEEIPLTLMDISSLIASKDVFFLSLLFELDNEEMFLMLEWQTPFRINYVLKYYLLFYMFQSYHKCST